MLGFSLKISILSSSLITLILYIMNRGKYKSMDNEEFYQELLALFIVSFCVIMFITVCMKYTVTNNISEMNTGSVVRPKNTNNKCPF